MPTIVILDDRASKARRLRNILEQGLSEVADLEILTAATVAEAELLLDAASLWIIDVFLLGDVGSDVSNRFIRDFLLDSEVPFCRCSSGSGLSKTGGYDGFGVFDDSKLRRMISWPETQAFVAKVAAVLSPAA